MVTPGYQLAHSRPLTPEMGETTPNVDDSVPASEEERLVAKVTMPQLGESVAEGTIGKWLKKPGDHVAKYEPLLEVITDKVNAEVPSPYEGVLKEILVEEGATVPNNAEIAVIEEVGSAGVEAPKAEAPKAEAPKAEAPKAEPTAPHSAPSTRARVRNASTICRVAATPTSAASRSLPPSATACAWTCSSTSRHAKKCPSRWSGST